MYWHALLDSGTFKSVVEIVETEGMDVTQLRRVMRLTLLAPEVKQGFDGCGPLDITKTVPGDGGDQTRLGAVPVHRRRATGADFCKGIKNQQRLVHCASVTLPPDAHAIECAQDIVACHGQYFAFHGSTQRTPPRGSGLSPA